MTAAHRGCGDVIKFLNKKIWWRHQMETCSALLALCAGNSPVTDEFPAQRPVMRSFDIVFDLFLNKRLSKQTLGCWFETLSRSLWCHCNIYCILVTMDTSSTNSEPHENSFGEFVKCTNRQTIPFMESKTCSCVEMLFISPFVWMWLKYFDTLWCCITAVNCVVFDSSNELWPTYH